MEDLKSDNAKSETSFTMKDIFHQHLIRDCQAKLHYQLHNPWLMHGIMGCLSSPEPSWHLCLLYVVGLLNVLVNSKGLVPLTVITSKQTDISPYLDFPFWQEVFVDVPRGGEQLAWWSRPSHKQGNFLTCYVLLDDTSRLVTCSNVHAAEDSLFPTSVNVPTQ